MKRLFQTKIANVRMDIFIGTIQSLISIGLLFMLLQVTALKSFPISMANHCML